MQRLRLIILMMIGVMVTACGSKDAQDLTKEEEFAIIKKCMARMNESGSKHDYVVSPRYDLFEFNSFLKHDEKVRRGHPGHDYDRNKGKVLDSLGWTAKDFIEFQKQIDKKYLGKSNPLLSKLSNIGASHSVISFSGIHKNLVFAEEIYYCDSITPSELAAPAFDKHQLFMSTGSTIFILKDGEVEEMIPDDGIVREYQCSH